MKIMKKPLVALIVIILAVAVISGVYIVMNLGSGPDQPTDATPTPDQPTDATPTPDQPTDATNPTLGVNSFQYKLSITLSGEPQSDMHYTYSYKNVGTQNMMWRLDVTTEEGTSTTIVNGAQQKVWMIYDDEILDISYAFTEQWDSIMEDWQDVQGDFADWPGTQEWTYTVDGTTARIYDVQTNPVLPDSLFEP
ncbi:MAG: hypothetical protein IAX21_11390 [Candidatus Bathyarchaeota archaeon]|nr:MAG: hypothetical protein IAX21_11390 [Candidatus Bathyarchaeota archaeon]